MVDRDEALEYFTKAIEATTGYTAAYLSRAKILLDKFEELRHATRSSEETPEVTALSPGSGATSSRWTPGPRTREELSATAARRAR